NVLDNALAASDPYSIARKIDGHSSYNNASDFVITRTPTKGKANEITMLEEEADISPSERKDYDYSEAILISEIFPNPIGKDDNEFIELYNNSDASVNLNGWRLGDESKRRYTMDAIINPREYYAVKRETSKIALNNSFDTVKLFMPLEDKPSKQVKYEKAKEGQSYNCIYDDKEPGSGYPEPGSKSECLWSDNVTPGAANEVSAINHPPSVDFDCPNTGYVGLPILFDSSDTIDEDGDILHFNWDFGDGATNTLAIPEHTYFKPGEYTVSLIVNDSEYEEKQEKLLIINYPGQEDLAELIESGQIIISELLPNPVGADNEGEWIEIFNQGASRVNLRGWQIDDAEGGSRPYTILDDIWLEAGAYYLLDREETGLALNNSSDAVRIINNEIVIDEVSYSGVKEGVVYALGNGVWSWSSEPTPGDKNKIKIITSTAKKSSSRLSANNKIRLDLKLEQLKYSDKGDLVRTRGTVAVLPGVFGSQYFYIVGSPGVQVYSYKKDFPLLSIGDYIEVSGEISELNGEKRIKTKVSSDIVNLEKRADPEPESCNCVEVNESYVGQLIKVQGEVVEQKSSSLYIDDGTDEQLVYIKKATGINPKRYKEGDKIAVTGILSQTKSGMRLMPRSETDIVKLNNEDDSKGQVLGEVAASDEWSLPARNKQLELFKYLLIIAGAIIIILGVVIFRFVRKKS
ncbi:lamin tail domain-containing protein, partial [Candidatus Parcubacteria bacterium]|nr:lamin tail domain-containing protein [Candidatus Parcubacteria bacterium]